jgi:hypothetical protein
METIKQLERTKKRFNGKNLISEIADRSVSSCDKVPL